MQSVIAKHLLIKIPGGGDDVADTLINEIDNILKSVAREHYTSVLIVQKKSTGEVTALDNAAQQWMTQSGVPFVPGQREYIYKGYWISIEYKIYSDASTVEIAFSDIDVEKTPWRLLDRKLVSFFNCFRIDKQSTIRMKFLSVK